MISDKAIRYCYQTLLAFGLVELTSLLKMSYMVGSKSAFFSASNIALPMTGILGGGTILTSSITLLRALAKWFVFGINPFSFLVFHIPGIVGVYYWRSTTQFIKLGLPLSAMLLFILHTPSAWLYTLYWLIPVSLNLLHRNSIFEKALATTFVAHAVGSVIWVYTIPMNTELWYLLIPVVAVERLIWACGITCSYYSIKGLENMWNNYKHYIFA
jgi:hypothetical protein